MMFEGNYKYYGTADNIDKLIDISKELDFSRKSLRDTMEGTHHTQTRTVIGIFNILNNSKGVLNKELMDKTIPLLDDVLKKIEEENNYYCTLIQGLLFIKLLPNGSIEEHYDWEDGKGGINDGMYDTCHRVHIPLTTNEECMFTIDGEKKHLKVGEIVEINNMKLHSIENGQTDRIHIVLDILGIQDRYNKYLDSVPEDTFYIKG